MPVGLSTSASTQTQIRERLIVLYSTTKEISEIYQLERE